MEDKTVLICGIPESLFLSTFVEDSKICERFRREYLNTPLCVPPVEKSDSEASTKISEKGWNKRPKSFAV
jgi:hypothetical protein